MDLLNPTALFIGTSARKGIAVALVGNICERVVDALDCDVDEQSETPTEPAPQEMREVNINTASADEISECLLIDIELAEGIVSLREQIGYYSSVDELFLVDGLGKKTISRVAGYVIV